MFLISVLVEKRNFRKTRYIFFLSYVHKTHTHTHSHSLTHTHAHTHSQAKYVWRKTNIGGRMRRDHFEEDRASVLTKLSQRKLLQVFIFGSFSL